MGKQNNSEIGLNTRFRGYDTKQVDRCLDELTSKIEKYEGYIRQLKERNSQLESEKISAYNEYLDNARELAAKKLADAEKQAQAIIAQANERVFEADSRLRQIEQQTGDRIADAQQSMMKIISFSGKVKQGIDQTFDEIQSNSKSYLNTLNQLPISTSTED